jgi:hypothetical protein
VAIGLGGEGQSSGRKRSAVGLPVVGKLAEQVARGWQLPERAAVALRMAAWTWGGSPGRCRMRRICIYLETSPDMAKGSAPGLEGPHPYNPGCSP